jgi:anti-sigma factor RsiW
MASANYPITTELISDYVGGRLDAEDVRVIEEAIDHDEAIATAVADARKVDSRMTISLARRVAGHRDSRARGASDFLHRRSSAD